MSHQPAVSTTPEGIIFTDRVGRALLENFSERYADFRIFGLEQALRFSHPRFSVDICTAAPRIDHPNYGTNLE
jgi:hypothetical protein